VRQDRIPRESGCDRCFSTKERWRVLKLWPAAYVDDGDGKAGTSSTEQKSVCDPDSA
jgi:hypothetical protein